MAADKEDKIAKKKCVTPKFRVSFPHVFKPSSFEGQEPKYSLVMLFVKGSELKDMKRAANNAAVEKWGPKEKWPKNMRNPFRDGDEKAETDGYKGCTFVSASSKQRPQVVDNQVNEIIEESVFYPGCYARATLIAFAYDTKGNKGISFALQNIQKLGDGPAFSGRKNAKEEFDAVEDDSEDADNYTDSSDDDMGF
jgi:hypothetical protein